MLALAQAAQILQQQQPCLNEVSSAYLHTVAKLAYLQLQICSL